MKKGKNSNEKGITLIALVITIIILIILASIGINSGLSTIRSSKYIAFKNEMNLLQTKVNEIYSTKKEEMNTYGIDKDHMTNEQKNTVNEILSQSEVNEILNSKSNNIEELKKGFKYFSKDYLVNSLEIDGITQDYCINMDKRIIIATKPLEYNGVKYYMLEQMGDGIYNVEYSVQEGDITFDVTYEIIASNSYEIKVKNIKSKGYSNKWQIRYKLEDNNYYDLTGEFTGSEGTCIVEKLGKYEIRVVHGDDIQSEPAILDITKIRGYNNDKQVNVPVLVAGMTEIMYKNPTDTEKGSVIEKDAEEFLADDWYDYKDKRWANVKTEDGSMWVWIPRFAYRINPSTQTTSVVFLIDDTDNYYDENGNIQVAKRCTDEKATIDTTTGYTVHPAFTNETSINYRNGGWDKELTGIWVAKFEAGYVQGNNSAPEKASSVSYTQTDAYISSTEKGAADDTIGTARNWLDGIYGTQPTKIKYPTFQGITYSMNYINHNDAYNIASVLTEDGNIYGFNNNTTDSHLMKDSEWGAIAYLSQSEYGLNGKDIYINNITLNSRNAVRTKAEGKSGVDSVYAVTGTTTGSSDAIMKKSTIDNIMKTTGNTPYDEIYVWNQKTGQGSSTTGTIYGIYDLSGGGYERTAAYVINSNGNLKNNGVNMAYDGENLKLISTKYTTVHQTAEISGMTKEASSQANYEVNSKIFGSAIQETSSYGTGITSWYKDYSIYPQGDQPFFIRSGYWEHGSKAGLFFFKCSTGFSSYKVGFRPVLVTE